MTQHVATATGVQSLHVLLVDDDAFVLELMTDILEELGVASVQVARSGLEGLSVCRQSTVRPNVIICVLCMPHLGGMDFFS